MSRQLRAQRLCVVEQKRMPDYLDPDDNGPDDTLPDEEPREVHEWDEWTSTTDGRLHIWPMP